MTPLGREILGLIEAEGPIPVSRYMALCLGHPTHGYYATRDPFGAAGDFVTAPEISQIFGELIGLWCAEVWAMMGRPERVVLVELGPGRGTLMSDLLRAAKAAPGFREAARPILVETSPTLREIQAKTLAGHEIAWADTVEEALREPLPAIVVSNEFFDALPIRQFVRTAYGWRERLVGISDGGGLAFGLSPAAPDIAMPDAPEGAVREICPQALDIVTKISRHVAAHGGAMLAIDYGYGSGFGDTLQAVARHAFADPLDAPGDADLTAHVDFGALAAAAAKAGAAPMRLLSQADFLERLGVGHRAEALARAAPDRRAELLGAIDRLLDRRPRGMGALFKTLAVCDPEIGAPPAFEPIPRPKN